MTAQALAEKVVALMLSRDEFSRWLGVELLTIAPGACSIKMTVRKEMLNGFFTAHGGIQYAFADSALAFASNSYGNVCVAVENNIHYPAPVKDGDVLTAVATELNRGKTLATYQVILTNQTGRNVGIFRGTVYKTKDLFFPAS